MNEIAIKQRKRELLDGVVASASAMLASVATGEGDGTRAVDAVTGQPLLLVQEQLDKTLDVMQKCKPLDRSELDRLIAVAITDLQKIAAWWEAMVLRT